eukprot:scaffold99377_cov23-Tisochrysis_lutea.AAC.5
MHGMVLMQSHQEQQQKQQHVDVLEWRLVETEARLNSVQEAYALERAGLQVEVCVRVLLRVARNAIGQVLGGICLGRAWLKADVCIC